MSDYTEKNSNLIPQIDIPCFAWNSQAEQGFLFFKAKSLVKKCFSGFHNQSSLFCGAKCDCLCRSRGFYSLFCGAKCLLCMLCSIACIACASCMEQCPTHWAGFYSLFIQMLKNIVYVYFLRSKLLASFMPIVWNIWNKITSKITVTIMISVCHLV